jgi:uncharacterized protein
MNVAEELQKLQQLLESGGISEEEFAQAKAKLLKPSPPPLLGQFAMGDQEQQTRMWAMFLHLSLLGGFVVPLGGLIAPIIIWQIKKDELPGIEEHWKIVANWLISYVIYFAVCLILCFVFVGFFLLPILGILGIVFPILGGIKANNGEVWKYPMSISFIK